MKCDAVKKRDLQNGGRRGKLKTLGCCLLPPANEVCEGYVFTGVCLSTGGGSTWVGPPNQVYPLGRYTPRDQVHPLDRYTLDHVHPPWDQVHPQDQVHPPGSSACWEIRATSGRYASYWNAYLFFLCVQ